VEDDAILRRGLARLFPGEQYQVMQASDGEQATDLITHHLPDLIICDFRLPKKNGLEVLSYLHQLGQMTAFILVTAYYSEELVREAERQGAAAVLEKPIELQFLRKQCTEILRGLGRSLMA